MPVTQTISPARELVATNAAHFPNESAEYRTARNELLVEEIELRRHIERVAAQRRALSHGGEIQHDFEPVSETGSLRFSSLFGDKVTLMVYGMMYGPERKAPCPLCTSFLSSWNGTVVNLRERSAIAVYGTLAHRSAAGLQKTAWLHESPVCLRPVRRLHTYLCQSGRRRRTRLRRFHPT
jgi:predicted dithiol-disulfide oxidoreductase (DUF899 family)